MAITTRHSDQSGNLWPFNRMRARYRPSAFVWSEVEPKRKGWRPRFTPRDLLLVVAGAVAITTSFGVAIARLNAEESGAAAASVSCSGDDERLSELLSAHRRAIRVD